MASTFGLPLGDGALLSGRPLVQFQSDAQMNSQNVDALEIGDTDGSPIEVRIPLIAPDDPNSPVRIPAITTHEMREGDNGLYNTFHRFLSDFIQEQCNLDRTRHLERSSGKSFYNPSRFFLFCFCPFSFSPSCSGFVSLELYGFIIEKKCGECVTAF